MRYLVFGDVHANLAALDAVLAEGNGREVDGYLFVGDLVGYGPDPLECIERLLPLQERGCFAWVLGNHELALRGEVTTDGYSQEAVQTLNWTRTLVEAKPWAKEFLASGHLVVEANERIWLTHDSLSEAGSGTYHRSPRNAKVELACLRWHKGRVCFYGHTHMMRAELSTAETEVVLVPMLTQEDAGRDSSPVRMGADAIGWIGTGSVGLPTNAQRRAEYLILDDKAWHVEKYAVAYPREQARAHTREVLSAVCAKEVAERIARWL